MSHHHPESERARASIVAALHKIITTRLSARQGFAILGATFAGCGSPACEFHLDIKPLANETATRQEAETQIAGVKSGFDNAQAFPCRTCGAEFHCEMFVAPPLRRNDTPGMLRAADEVGERLATALDIASGFDVAE